MKVKVKTGKGFGGCVRYCLDPKKSEFLGGTAPTSDAFMQRAAALRSMRPDCKKPVLHFSLSQPAGERLTDTQWHEVSHQFLSELGLSDHDFIMARHTDTEHDHVHLVVSKINPSGQIWNERNSAKRAMAACTKIEKDLGLTQTKTLQEFRQETGHARRVVRDGATQEFRRTGKVQSRVQFAIQKRKAAENEQNRGTHSVAKAARNGQRRVDSKTVSVNESRGRFSQNPAGKVRISSSQTRSGEVIFKIDSRPVAVVDATGQHIELYSLDPAAIDLAIQQAVKSGQIPLEIYGTDEFQAAARQRAAVLKVPVSPRFPNLGSGNKQELTPNQKGEVMNDKPYQNPFGLENPNPQSTPQTRLAASIAAIQKEPQTWRQASMVLEWVRMEKSRGMPAAQAIALARESNSINPRWLDNAARALNVPLPDVPEVPEDEQEAETETDGQTDDETQTTPSPRMRA